MNLKTAQEIGDMVSAVDAGEEPANSQTQQERPPVFTSVPLAESLDTTKPGVPVLRRIMFLLQTYYQATTLLQYYQME